MPHVTTFRFKANPGARDAVMSHFEKWAREEQVNAPGVMEYLVVASNEDPDECMAYVCFDTTESYQKNSDRPGQGVWYQEFQALIQGEPEWFNGTLAIAADAT
jgi:quinol monooxygenase YgiN